MPTQDELESKIQEQIATALGVYADEIEVDVPFTDLGLDSVVGLELIGELEDQLDRRLSPNLLQKHPTIRKLAQHLTK